MKNIIQIPDVVALKIENNSILKCIRIIPSFISVNKISSGLPVSISKKKGKKSQMETTGDSEGEVSKLKIITVDGSIN